MHTTYSVKQLLLGLALVGGLVTSTARSYASPEFPGAMQEAGGMPCVPLCTLCHTSNPGTATTWTSKTLPKLLNSGRYGLEPGDANSVKKAYGLMLNDDGIPLEDRQKILNDVKAGKDENGADICGPTYGCAMAASLPAPKRDLLAPAWLVGAMVFGGLLRRRKPAR